MALDLRAARLRLRLNDALPSRGIRSSTEIQLTEELERLVEANVQSGKFQSTSELVAAALRLMERTASASRDAQATDLIEEGWLASQLGETVDGDGVFDRIDAELEALETPTLS